MNLEVKGANEKYPFITHLVALILQMRAQNLHNIQPFQVSVWNFATEKCNTCVTNYHFV